MPSWAGQPEGSVSGGETQEAGSVPAALRAALPGGGAQAGTTECGVGTAAGEASSSGGGPGEAAGGKAGSHFHWGLLFQDVLHPFPCSLANLSLLALLPWAASASGSEGQDNCRALEGLHRAEGTVPRDPFQRLVRGLHFLVMDFVDGPRDAN